MNYLNNLFIYVCIYLITINHHETIFSYIVHALVMTNSWRIKVAIDIVNSPIKNVSFHRYVNLPVYQKVRDNCGENSGITAGKMGMPGKPEPGCEE